MKCWKTMRTYFVYYKVSRNQVKFCVELHELSEDTGWIALGIQFDRSRHKAIIASIVRFSSKISNSSNSQEKADSSLLADEYICKMTCTNRAPCKITDNCYSLPLGRKLFLAGVESGKKEQQEKDMADIERLKELQRQIEGSHKLVLQNMVTHQQALLEARKAGAKEALKIIEEIRSHISKYYRKVIIARVSCDEDWKRIQSKLKSLEAK